MRLVIDTNILISALLKDSSARRILLLPFFEFYIPEFALEEIEKHKFMICKRGGLTETEFSLILSILLDSISIVPRSRIQKLIEQAANLIGQIDEFDIPFAALALAIPNDGIWSEDKHLLKQRKIKIWKTEDLLKML